MPGSVYVPGLTLTSHGSLALAPPAIAVDTADAIDVSSNSPLGSTTNFWFAATASSWYCSIAPGFRTVRSNPLPTTTLLSR